jgi:hypothetical protein
MSTIPGGSEPTDFHRLEYRKVRVDTRRESADGVIAEQENEGWRIEHIAMLDGDPVLILTFSRPRSA